MLWGLSQHTHLCDSVAEEGHQWVIETLHIEQAHGLCVVAQLLPGDHLQQLLQCAKPTWKGGGGVAGR